MEKCSFVFPNTTSVEIMDDLKHLKQVSMSSFIYYAHKYRKVEVQSKSVSVWTYVIIFCFQYLYCISSGYCHAQDVFSFENAL